MWIIDFNSVSVYILEYIENRQVCDQCKCKFKCITVPACNRLHPFCRFTERSRERRRRSKDTAVPACRASAVSAFGHSDALACGDASNTLLAAAELYIR